MDPHIWISLRNAGLQVNNICSGLVQVDPAIKITTPKTEMTICKSCNALDEELSRSFVSTKSKIFIVHHPAWTYFARDYGLEAKCL